jgi:hypothetical protein
MREFKHVNTGETVKFSNDSSVISVLENSPSWEEINKPKNVRKSPPKK